MAITIKKCPLCMGRIKDGVCAECGYTIPDEEEFEQMSSLYDFEPDNYPKPDYEPEYMEMEELGPEVMYAEPEKPRIPSIRVVDNNTPPPSPPPHPRHNPAYYQNGNAQGTANNNANQPITPGAANNNANQPYYNQNANYGQNNTGGRSSYSVSAKDIPWLEFVLTLMIPICGIVFGIKRLRLGKNDPVQKMMGTILLILGIFRMFLI